MPKRVKLSIVAAVLLVIFAMPAAAIQCVPYAREVSGLNLKGNAWEWWHAAAGLYERGRAPKSGAVLVFPRQGAMRYGHVSVVTRVVSNRLVLVDHANWAPAGSEGRGKVTRAVPVLDVSARNDWSQVRVWYRPAEDYGNKVYTAEGFVYQAGANAGASGPAIEPIALRRAASIFPADKAFADAAPATAPMPAPVPMPAPASVAAQPAAVPANLPVAPAAAVVAEHSLGHPSTDDLVKVAHHVFRPQRTTAQAPAVDDFVFN